MKIKRFDEVEFKCLKCAHPDGMGYYSSGLYAVRALVLMKEGIIKNNPQDNWIKTGWSLTKNGLKYYEEFYKKLMEKHGHVWKTYKDTQPKDYGKDSKYANEIDIFAMSEGTCNGPKCKKCGYSFCQHCTSEFNVKECVEK